MESNSSTSKVQQLFDSYDEEFREADVVVVSSPPPPAKIVSDEEEYPSSLKEKRAEKKNSRNFFLGAVLSILGIATVIIGVFTLPFFGLGLIPFSIGTAMLMAGAALMGFSLFKMKKSHTPNPIAGALQSPLEYEPSSSPYDTQKNELERAAKQSIKRCQENAKQPPKPYHDEEDDESCCGCFPWGR